LNSRNRRILRQIAHHLDPVVTVGNTGVSEAVAAELDRALSDHELIKVRINETDRELRRDLTTALVTACKGELVQTIGRIVVLYRGNPDAKPDLSNIARSGQRLA
jgi:RNA-binding protein